MTPVLNEPLSQLSLLFVSASMGFLALALLIFSFELAQLVKTEGDTRVITKGERVGFLLLWVATAILGVGVVLRGIAANRVPWANMYEFAISTAFLLINISFEPRWVVWLAPTAIGSPLMAAAIGKWKVRLGDRKKKGAKAN